MVRLRRWSVEEVPSAARADGSEAAQQVFGCAPARRVPAAGAGRPLGEVGQRGAELRQEQDSSRVCQVLFVEEPHEVAIADASGEIAGDDADGTPFRAILAV